MKWEPRNEQERPVLDRLMKVEVEVEAEAETEKGKGGPAIGVETERVVQGQSGRVLLEREFEERWQKQTFP